MFPRPAPAVCLTQNPASSGTPSLRFQALVAGWSLLAGLALRLPPALRILPLGLALSPQLEESHTGRCGSSWTQTMEAALAVTRLPPHDPKTPALSVVDMHTGGEPLRIVHAGCPEVVGPTLLAKRRYMRQHLDYIRQRLVFEPRGHRDMYGAILVPSELPDAHLGVLFLHNEGYSSMCGHAVLALGRFALDFGLVPAPPEGAGEARVNIHCPCGLVTAFVECEGGRSCGPVRFHSVPAFVLASAVSAVPLQGGGYQFLVSQGYTVRPPGFGEELNDFEGTEFVSKTIAVLVEKQSPWLDTATPRSHATLDLTVNVPGHGKVVVDIAYGGAFYAFISAEKLGLDVCSAKTRDLVDAASALTGAVKAQFKINHPESEDLGFLYGTILTDGKDAYSEEPTTNICVFADEQVDRSPTGSGVTARIALQYHKGLLQLNKTRAFKSSATGSVFTGCAVREAKCGDFKAVIVEVAGQAHYTGTANLTVEDGDPLRDGFLLK